MGQELVSVIMPTFNSGKFLSASIESILAQTYQNLELLITDDASTDSETLRLINEFAERDSRVKVERLAGNHGPGYARNQSIKRAQGRYIAFCDSDDRWMPEKLERQIKFMTEKGCALTCTSYIVCDANDQETGVVIAPARITLGMMKRDNKVGCLTAVYDTHLLGRKFYMPELRKRQDWALFLSILMQQQPAYALTEPLAYYRRRSNSVSSNKLSLIKYNVNVYQSILGFSKLKSYAYFFCLFMPTYYLKVLKRQCDSRAFLNAKLATLE